MIFSERPNKIPVARIQTITIVLVGILFATSIIFDSFLQTEPLHTGSTVRLDSSWTITVDGEVVATDVTLPYLLDRPIKEKECVATTTLPDRFPNHDTSMALDTSMTSLEVSVDGNTLYRFDDTGSPWPMAVYGGGMTHFVRLPDWAQGKQIALKMVFSTDNPFSGRIAAPTLGTKADQLIEQLQEWPSLVFGYSFLLVGLICVLVSLGMKRGTGRENLFYFGWIELALGSWVFTQSCSKVFLFRNPALPMNFSLAALYLLPFLLSKFVCISYRVADVEKKLCDWSFLFPVAYVVIGILQLSGIAQYTDFLVASGLALVLYILLFFVSVLIDYRKGNKNLGNFVAAILVLFVSVISEELLLLFRVVLPNAVILHLGMSVFGVILFWHSAQIIREGNLNQFREQMLMELAFTDSLTGLGNRSAYENRIKAITDGKKKHEVIGVLLMDINNLKQINDSQGHMEGDKLLKEFSHRLRKIVPGSTETYRIGGDEFVCLIPSITEENLRAIAGRIEKTRFSGLYSVAVGHALYVPKRKEKITNVIFRADSAMYACKNRMKQIG